MISQWPTPIHELGRLGRHLGLTLAAARDDLLSFPLASSKVRGLDAHLASLRTIDAVVTNGGIDSNHCRTLAFMAAERGIAVHLVLHGEPDEVASRASLRIYTELGATYEVVAPEDIQSAIDLRRSDWKQACRRVAVVPGGCHTPAAAAAYRDEAIRVFDDWGPDVVVVASGTGAIQGGLVAAAAQVAPTPRVVGISVARDVGRGVGPVRAAAAWAGSPDAAIEFRDEFRDGGYGRWGKATARAVELGWSHGLPLDGTYTGKAFRALTDLAHSGELKGRRVLFWHTGGLWNYLSSAIADPPTPGRKRSRG